MEQKRKIVIPLGGSSRDATATPPPNYDGGMTVPAPLFDEEATLSAQPVIPLAEASPTGKSRLPLIALLIVLAVSAGIVGGFAIGVYRSRQNKQATTATAATTTTATTATSGATAQPSVQLPVIASEKPPEQPPTRTTVAADTDSTTERRSARENRAKTDDEQEVIPPVEIRERPSSSSSRKERREAKSERAGSESKDDGERVAKQQRKERRRRAREADDQNADLNQQIERAGREVNRIREIFEGQRP